MTREEAVIKLKGLMFSMPAAKAEINEIIELLASPWISVKDDFPYNHKELINTNNNRETLLVLAVTPSGYTFFDYMKRERDLWFWQNKSYFHAYWMPIPELPKE